MPRYLHSQTQALENRAWKNEIEPWKAQRLLSASDMGSLWVYLPVTVACLWFRLLLVGRGVLPFCWPWRSPWGQPSVPRNPHSFLHSAKHVLAECESGLMLAHALAGPTVEQQGEMARSGGRMLATLEPEQVRTSTTGGVFQSKTCRTLRYHSQVCVYSRFIPTVSRII